MKAGVYTMSMQEYQRDPAPEPSLSSGVANILLSQSPRHAWFAHPRLNPDYQSEDNTDFDLGACSHAVLLEGESSVEAIDAKDWRTNAAKDAREQARARGQIPVLAHKMADIRAMADAARLALKECELGALDLASGAAEQVILWQRGAVWCRARPDWMRADRKLLIDYKSTSGSAEPSSWIRTQMVPMGYDLQAVHYLRGNAATGGSEHADWIFLVQENYPPFECSFVGLSPEMLDLAERKWQFAMALWESCTRKNEWHGYPRRVAYAEPMPWQIADAEARGMSIEDRAQP